MDDHLKEFMPKSWFFFSVLGWKSKGVKSKGHFKSKGFKALNVTEAKSDIHKGLAKRSSEPGWSWRWSNPFYSGKHKFFKGKCAEFTILYVLLRLLDNYL